MDYFFYVLRNVFALLALLTTYSIRVSFLMSWSRMHHFVPQVERQQVYEWLKALQSDTNTKSSSSIRSNSSSRASITLSSNVASTASAEHNPAVLLDAYFEAFGVGAKNRKQTLANALW